MLINLNDDQAMVVWEPWFKPAVCIYPIKNKHFSKNYVHRFKGQGVLSNRWTNEQHIAERWHLLCSLRSISDGC